MTSGIFMALKTKNKLSIELKLLLLILEDRLYDSKNEEIIKVCSKGVDWNTFKCLAIRHKVLLLVYGVLKNNYVNHVPESLLVDMKNIFMVNSARNLYFTAFFHKIIEYFNINGIHCVPLKGPVISEQLYGDIILRSFSDLDILVPEKQAYQAFNILIDKGFTPELDLNESQFDSYMNSEDHIILFTENRKIIVELHWELSARYLSKPFTFEQIRSQLQEYNFSGKTISTFSHEDLLVYLCLHGSKHIWETLELLYLVANLLKFDLDWNRVLTLSKTTFCYKKLLLGLSLCKRFFNCHLPEEIQDLIVSDPKTNELEEYVILLLLDPVENHLWDISKSKFTKYQFAALDKFQDKIRYLFFIVLTPTNNDWASISLSSRLSFLYYLIRPFRLFQNLLRQKKGAK